MYLKHNQNNPSVRRQYGENHNGYTFLALGQKPLLYTTTVNPVFYMCDL